jgi:V/A-type H+-transporting ATPase subunit D
MKKAFLSFALARTHNSHEELKKLIPEGKLVLSAERERIFSLSIPRLEIKESEISDYDLLNTESELDVGLKITQELLKDMMEMARLWKAVELLSNEIEITRRRVNALEHILIPNIKETIHYIANRMEEMERSFQVQLMRIKEIVRKH